MRPQPRCWLGEESPWVQLEKKLLLTGSQGCWQELAWWLLAVGQKLATVGAM